MDRSLGHTKQDDFLGDVEREEMCAELIRRSLVQVDLLRLNLCSLQHFLRLEGVGEGNKWAGLHHRHLQK